ncbi:LuxR C-terminal-related transcriptional regulator [Roseateles sp. P5_E1]
MDFLVPATALAGLEAAAQGGEAAALAELAWQLRQRDSRRALALCEQVLAMAGLTPSLQARLALSRCEIAALQGRLDEAETQLAQARRSGGGATLEGDALLAEAVVAKARGQRERELGAYARAAACHARGPDPRRQAIARAWLAYEQSFATPADADAPAAEPAAAAFADAALALPLSRRDPARAAALFLRAADAARHWGLLRHALVCTINAGTALQGLGEFDRAAACYDQATLESRAAGWPALIGACETRLGALLKEIGRLDEALVLLGDALASLAGVPPGINKANACAELAQTLLALGRGVEAVGPMTEAIAMYRAVRSTDNLTVNLLGLARALSAAGQVDAAQAALDEAEQLIARHGFNALVVGVQEALTEIHRRYPHLAPPPGLVLPNATLHHGEATLAEGLKIVGWKAPASLHVALAEDWAAAGDMGRAYGHARQALALKDGETERMRLSQTPAALRRGAVPQGAGATAAERLLSPKEREVLVLVARGYANKEIATALAVSDETVKSHLKKIYAKLEAGSRKHAVTRARALGVIGVAG